MTKRPNILSLTGMHEAGLSLIKQRADLRMASALDAATLEREVKGADGLIIRTGGVVDESLLNHGRDLRVVGRHGVGYDQIDVAAATARGVQVVYTPGANTQSVAEHVFAMMIALSKFFPQMTRALEAGNYHARTSMTGREIAGKSLGIVGFGRIGRRVARIATQGFHMRVVYNDIVPAPPELETELAVKRVDLTEALRSDYVTLHVPLDSSTRSMIDAAAIALMSPKTILINTCRGPVVDEAAVARALDEKRLWGYGGDVFTVEPPPRAHPLIGRPDVLLTPHSAAQTEEGLRTMAVTIAHEVLDVLDGKMPDYPVNNPAEVEETRQRLGLEPLYGRTSLA